jgi:hypothetical protein
MRNQKRFTTQTFTHRVDHDGGKHRGPKAPTEPAVCAGCGAVYQKRRWYKQGSTLLHLHRDPAAPIPVRICPGCRRAKNDNPHGFLHADGTFTKSHRDEIERFLRNEAAAADVDNPIAHVLNWGDDGTGGLLVTTTSEHLAIRLGRALEKTFNGRLLFGFSHENKLAHVWWHRDDQLMAVAV